MNLYVVGHDGVWPVGAVSIAVADSQERAKELVKEQLDSHPNSKLHNCWIGEPELVPMDKPMAKILLDGDY